MPSLTIQERAVVVELPILEFHEVGPERWDDFEQLFESKGGPKSCWCMVWRKGASSTKGSDRKIAMKDIVCNAIPVGLLGYDKGEPVAWCSIAPRETHRELGGLAKSDALGEQVWSLTCMYLVRRLRNLRLASQIIDSAVQHAAAKGATVVEAYPVEADSPSFRFMGFVHTFLAAGFQEVGLAGSRRHVMRRTL